MDIHFIAAEGCLDCLRMETILLECLKGTKHILIRLDAEDDRAIDYAVNNNIDDIPSCKIGDVVVQGREFTSDEIRGAFARLI